MIYYGSFRATQIRPLCGENQKICFYKPVW